MRDANENVFVFRQKELPILLAVFLILGALALGEMVIRRDGDNTLGAASPNSTTNHIEQNAGNQDVGT